MAIYHFSGKVVSRSKGKSAIASAAYRSGEKMYDERQERTFDYSRKRDIIFKEILLPPNAPTWMSDRAKLWNAVEKSENRKDSQLAREINFSLPIEFSKEQNIELAKEFIKNEFISRGMIADLCIHSGASKKKTEQPHAHVMLTMRAVTENGFGLKDVSWNAKENYLSWRESWAEHVNKYLALNGVDQRIDHRSYEEQGIDLIPQNKRGPEFTRKRLLEKTKEHLEIARQNGEKIYEDPKIALHALSTQHSTFTKQDIARFINRHTDGAEQFTKVFEKVYNSPDLVALGLDQKGNGRYSSREMVNIEKDMVDIAQTLSDKYTHAVDNPEHDRLSMAVSRAGKNIKELFVEPKHFNYSTLSEEQKTAVDHITKGNDLACVLGYAGTGKSYMLGAARELWEREGYRVRGLSLTGVAARGLEDGSGIKSQTLAKQFRSWEKGREVLSERDVVVLDEVGMVSSRQLHRVLYYARNAGAKLVTTGDFSQLPSIEAGAAARVVMERVGYAELTEVRRQVEPWQQEATKQLAQGKIEEAIDSYYQRGFVHKGDMQKMLAKWSSGLSTDKTQMMIAATNEEVNQLNLCARKIMSESGILGEDHEVVTYNDKLNIAQHEKILFLRNNYDLGIMNGTLGEISAINQNEISVIIGSKTCKIDIEKYNYFTYGYAATIHKLQGATFDDTQVLVSPYFNRNLANVAFTRHRHEMNIYHSQDLPDLIKTISRDGSKDTTLDYPSCAKDIISYRDIQPLGDLGYTAFHHRDLVKELERIGEKDVSFMTARQERGLVAGVVDHYSKQYLVLEQEKVFKLYNQNCFDAETEKELVNSIGCFVAITKQWDEKNHAFNAAISNTGLSLLESSERSKEHIFVLGAGVKDLQDNIVSLESKYQKPVDFTENAGDYGIYRGLTNIGDTKYGLIETSSSLKMLSAERVDGIEENKWIISKDQITAINQSDVPTEHLFDAKQTVFNAAREGSFITSAIHEHKAHKEHYEIESLRRSLVDSAETVVESLLGEPNSNLSSSTEWRYGNKGSLAVSVAGDKRGLWYNFETGESGDLIKLIQNQTGMSFADTLKHAASMGSYIVLPKIEHNTPKKISASKTLEYAQKLVAESKPIYGTIVESYLKETRGISITKNLTEDLRYHPGVYTKETKQYLPAMLSIGRDKDGVVKCVQATYLDPQTISKADLDVNKRTYASPSGALVHLQKQEAIENKTSYLAEGVETGLSIKDAAEPNSDIAVTLGKSNFTSIDPQSVGQKVVFCLDNDGAKTFTDNVINKAAQRLIDFGKEVFIAIPVDANSDKPEKAKIDFNDVARTQGIEAVKSIIANPISYTDWKNSIDVERQSSEAAEHHNKAAEHQTNEAAVKGLINEPHLLRTDELNNDVEQRYPREQIEPIQEEFKENIKEQDQASHDDLKSFQERFERERPELATEIQEELASFRDLYKNKERPVGKEVGVLSYYSNLEHGHEITDKQLTKNPEMPQQADIPKQSCQEILSTKVEIIVEECTKLIGSADSCINELVDIVRKGGDSQILRDTMAENRKTIIQCLRTNCGRDMQVLSYLSKHETKLFNDINRICGNILTRTIKDIELKEGLNLTKDKQVIQDKQELFKEVLAAENGYKDYKDKFISARDNVDRIFKYGGSAEDLRQQRENRSEAKEAWTQYAVTISKDVDTVRAISQHNPALFKDMNKSFNNMFIDTIKRDDMHNEHLKKYNSNISTNERIQTIGERYTAIKQEFLSSQEAVDRIFKYGGSVEELKEQRENRREAKEKLDNYSNEVCKDKDFMEHLKINDKDTFKEMNGRLNEIARSISERMKGFEKDF